MNEKSIKSVFHSNLIYYLQKAGHSQKDLAEFLGISQAAISKWKSGQFLPQLEKLDDICSFLHIARSQLVTERNPDIYQIYTDQAGNAFFRKYDQLNDTGLNRMHEYLDFLLSNPAYKKGYRQTKMDA